MPTIEVVAGHRTHALFLLLGAILALGAALLARPQAASAAPALRGVTVDVLWDETAAQTRQDIDDAVALGANMIRVTVSWQALEPTRGGPLATWYLDRLDDAVRYAQAARIKVLLTPIFTPCWASSAAGAPARCDDPAHPVADAAAHPPADPATYARFAAGLAARYRGALAGLEVWNEPNMASFWTSANPARDYVALVRATSPAVKAASPGLPVVVGSLSGGDAGFYRQLRAAGLTTGYDGFSVHPYNDGRSPDALIDPQFASASFLQGLRALRTAMQDACDRHALWITELGWNTSTQRGLLWLDGVTQATQALYLTRALSLLADRTSGLGSPVAVSVYRLRDLGTDPADPQDNYGLMAQGRARKPAFAAVRVSFGGWRAQLRRQAARRRAARLRELRAVARHAGRATRTTPRARQAYRATTPSATRSRAARCASGRSARRASLASATRARA